MMDYATALALILLSGLALRLHRSLRASRRELRASIAAGELLADALAVETAEATQFAREVVELQRSNYRLAVERFGGAAVDRAIERSGRERN